MSCITFMDSNIEGWRVWDLAINCEYVQNNRSPTSLPIYTYIFGHWVQGQEFFSHCKLQNVATPVPFLPSATIACKTIPSSLKIDCPQKRKPVLTRSTWGRLCKPFFPKLHVYHVGDAWVRTWWVWNTFVCFNRTLDFF